MKTKILQKSAMLFAVLTLLALWLNPLSAQNRPKNERMQKEYTKPSNSGELQEQSTLKTQENSKIVNKKVISQNDYNKYWQKNTKSKLEQDLIKKIKKPDNSAISKKQTSLKKQVVYEKVELTKKEKEKLMKPELFDEISNNKPVSFTKASGQQFGNAPAWNWSSHFGGTESDIATDVVADSLGNIYVTGHFSGEISLGGSTYTGVGKRNAFIAKFNSTGTLAWFNQLSPGFDTETIETYSICLDNDDNVYITGYYTGVVNIGAFSLPDDANHNLFYAKYNSDGVLTHAQHEGLGVEDLLGLRIATDDSSNVYIIGKQSISTDSREPSIFLKYDTAGNLSWRKDFDEGLFDLVLFGESIYISGAINLDNDGYLDDNVTLEIPIGYNDIFIAKTNLDGNFIWGNKVGHNNASGDSYNAYLDIDNNENLYLTGDFRNDVVLGATIITDNASAFIASFDSSGTFSWATQLNNSNNSGLSVDGVGNSYVISSANVFNFNSSGVLQWTKELSYNSSSIDVNYAGNYFTCGSYNAFIYLNQLQGDITETWEAHFGGNSGTSHMIGMLSDDEGFVYNYGWTSNTIDFYGTTVNRGIFFSKHSVDGQLIWLNQFADVYMPFGSQGNYINIDTVNNFLYITGVLNDELIIPGQTTHTPTVGGSMILMKYDLDGNYIWSLQEDFAVNVPSVVADRSGNVIVSGTFTDTVTIGTQELISAGGADGFIAKYDADGNFLWAKRAGGETVEYLAITTTDQNDNIFLSGEFTSVNVTVGDSAITLNEGDGNIIFAKLNSNGDVQFVKSFAGSSSGYDWACWPTGIKTDVFGNIYMKGSHGDSVSFDNEILTSPYYYYGKFITKIDNNGNVLWVKSSATHGGGYWFDYNQFDTDSEGNVYFGMQVKDTIDFGVDYQYSAAGNCDLLIVNYMANGDLNWVKTIQGNGSFNWISSVAVSSDRHVLITGFFQDGLVFDNVEINSPTRHGFMAALSNIINPTGLTENFDDGDLVGWSADDGYTLTNTADFLTANVDKSGWNAILFNFPQALNILNYPYLSVNLQTDVDVNLRFSLVDVNGTWTDGNNPGFDITIGDYQEIFIDFSDRWFNWEETGVDPENIVSLAISVNMGDDYAGTFYMDNLRIGDAANIPFYDVTFNVNMNYQIDKGVFDPLIDYVDLPASFNGWNGDGAMDDSDGDGVYSSTYTFQHGEYHEYKFRMNGDWNQPHDFPDGGPNRWVHVLSNSTQDYWFNDEYNDIQAIWFDEPTENCDLGNTAPVTVQVTNTGVEAINGFDIGLMVDGVEIAVESSNQVVNPGDTVAYSFAATIDLYHNDFSRRYLIQAYTISDMDYLPENDTNTWNKFVYGDYTDLPDWTTYTICDGLPDWSVFAVEQDDQGRIWAAGFNGVSVIDGDTWTYYNSENQLPVDYVWTLFKDSQGNMWLPSATDTIVSVFDGTNFTYHHLDAVYEECVYEDVNGNIWIGSWGYHGVAMYNGTSWKYYTTADGLLGDRVTSVSSDASGNVLVSTDGGVSVFNGTNWSEYQVYGKSGIYINEMFKDSQNNLWFMTDSLYRFDGTNWTNHTETDGIVQWLEQADEDMYGNIWFTGGSSLFKYDGTWTEYTSEDGMIPGGVNYDVFADSNRDIWVGSWRGGLSKFSQKSFADVTLNVNMNVQIELGLFNPAVDSVDVAGTFNDWEGSVPLTEIDSSRIYTITIPDLSVGDTIEYKFRKNASWDNNSHEFPDGGPNRIYVVAEDENVVDHWYNDMDYNIFNNNVGIVGMSIPNYCQPTSAESIIVTVENAGNEPVSQFIIGVMLDGTEVISESVSININPGETVEYTLTNTVDLYTTDFSKRYYFTIYATLENDYVTNNDTLFASPRIYGDYTNPEGWDSYTECNGLLHSGVFTLAQDSQNRIWAGGFKGLSVFNGNSWEHFNMEDSLPVDYYWAITNDANGNIWMSSVGDSSIVKYDGTSFTIHNVEGIFEECIYVDTDGNVWAGSWGGYGVAKYDGTTWTYYTEEDGLLSGIVVSISKDKDGNMLFATASGISKFDGINWSEFAVDGTTGSWVTEIYLDSQNRLWLSNENLYMFDGTTWTNHTELYGINGSIQDIDEDLLGRVWFGGGQTASVYDGTEWFTITGDVESTYIYTLQIDSNGDAWFGTYPTGLFKYDVEYPSETSVTFNYNMNRQIELGNFNAELDFVDLAGNFNEWSGQQLADTNADGIYSVTITNVNIGDSLEFKARINGDWATSEFPNGGANRIFVVQDVQNNLEYWYNNDYPDNISLNNVLLSQISIYPVPSSNKLYIHFNNVENGFIIEMLNSSGQKILTKQLNVFPGYTEELDISDKKAGIYLIRIYNEDNTVIKRIIKK